MTEAPAGTATILFTDVVGSTALRARLGDTAADAPSDAGQRCLAAYETFETWSDLYRALFPQNFGKSGAIYAFAQSVPAERIDPALRPFVPQLIGGENLSTIRDLLGSRSSLRLMSAVTTPSFLFQGRRDFAFDIDQAVDAYRRLAGPKRLYVGDFGHAPSTFPGPDLAREAAHLVQRPRPVRKPRVVAEVDEILVRHRHEALVQDGKPAHARVEHADGP